MWSDVSRLPLAGHRSLTLTRGFSASSAVLLPIPCPSPSSRQPILGITPGLCFLRNPSPYAIRLAPAPVISERTYGVPPFPVAMARIRRVVLSTGFLWRCTPVSIEGCRRPLLCPFGSSASASCAGWLSRWLNHTFALAAHRCLLDGIPGLRLPGSAVYPRFRPLRTSRRSGGYAVTPALGERGLHSHGN